MSVNRLMLGMGMIALIAPANKATGQASALTGIVGSATDFNFYWTRASASSGELKPERGSGANGVGFELSIDLPRSVTRRRRIPSQPDTTAKGSSCEARFHRRELLPAGTECADTTWTVTKRRRGRYWPRQYTDSAKIEKFDWKEPKFSFELAVGFSQAGAFVSRRPENDIRVSIREIPSVSIYADYVPEVRVGPLGRFTGYFGARSGLLSLIDGRAYTDTSITKFSGETFQLGPVGGIVKNIGVLSFFAEAAYMWRDFKSVNWERTSGLGTLPREIKLSGVSLAAGAQFTIKKSP